MSDKSRREIPTSKNAGVDVGCAGLQGAVRVGDAAASVVVEMCLNIAGYFASAKASSKKAQNLQTTPLNVRTSWKFELAVIS